MTEGANQGAVIIKRKKVVQGGGHHGGAWKVAYADFVTAMMAFFMLMWLLNATTEQQRKGIADYFSPNVPITRISGGGDGSFGGDDVFSETTAAQNGTGATSLRPTEGRQSLGAEGVQHREAQDDRVLGELAEAVGEGGGDSHAEALALRHVQTRLSDEGLVVEIFAQPDAPLFDEDTGAATDWLAQVAGMLAELLAAGSNDIAVAAHVAAEPVTVAVDRRWETSTARAEAMRQLLVSGGLFPGRVVRVTGHADRAPALPETPMSVRNDRLEITVLRRRP
jgi:chemotaxis protein MotB